MAYEFDCRSAGATGCGWKASAGTQEELVAKVADHAHRKHKVAKVSDTIVNYVRSAARTR